MKILRQAQYLILLLIFLSATCYASSVLDAGISGRSLGLAGAFPTMTEDAGNSIFGNPASLATMQTPEAISMYSEFTGDIYYSLFGFAIPTKIGGLSLGYAGNRSNEIISTTIDGNGRIAPSSSFYYYDDVYTLGWSRNITEKLSWGLRLNQFNRGTTDTTSGEVGTGTNFDFGFLLSINKYIDAGIYLTNILRNSMGWSNGTVEDLPIGTNIGLGLHRGPLNLFINYLNREDIPTKVGIGAEIDTWKNLKLRLGVQQSSMTNNEKYYTTTLGLGIKLGKVKIDYAYNQSDLLAYNARHYISLSLAFPQAERKVIKETTPIIVEEVIEEEETIIIIPEVKKTTPIVEKKTIRIKEERITEEKPVAIQKPMDMKSTLESTDFSDIEKELANPDEPLNTRLIATIGIILAGIIGLLFIIFKNKQ